MSKQTPPPGELRNVQVQMVSLVAKGANRRQFKVFKSADYVEPAEQAPTGDQAGLLQSVAAVVVKTLQTLGLVSVEKAAELAKAHDEAPASPASFAQVMANRQHREAFHDAKWAVMDVISSILESQVTNKVDLVSAAIDQFKAHVLPLVPAFTVQKSADAIDQDGAVDGDISGLEAAADAISVAKAGRKISQDRLARLKEAVERLSSVISEAEAAPDNENEGEIEVTKTELQEIIKSALAPVEERLAKIEKGDEAPVEEQTNVAEIVKAAVSEAVGPLTERLEKVEKARGVSNAQPAAATAPVQKSEGFTWGGAFIGSNE